MADQSLLQGGVSTIGQKSPNLVDIWSWWRKALANPKEIGKSLPVHDGDPQQGYYRIRYGKDRPYEPVAIWMEDGQWLAYRGGKEARADEIWTFVCRHPVSYEAYQAAADGKGWPDDDKVVAAQVKPPEPTIGDNSASVDEAEALKDQIDAALKGMEPYKVISDDATAAKALSLRNRLNELSGQADKVRVKQKEPHLDAGKAVDAKWQPLVKSAKAGADAVRDAIGSWETKKLQDQRKREREAADALQAEQDAMRAAEEAEGTVLTQSEAMLAPAPVEAAPAPIQPSYGKAASVSVKVVVDEVTDWQALAIYMCAHPVMQDTLRQLAQRALDAGRTNIPGITTTETAKVR